MDLVSWTNGYNKHLWIVFYVDYEIHKTLSKEICILVSRSKQDKKNCKIVNGGMRNGISGNHFDFNGTLF